MRPGSLESIFSDSSGCGAALKSFFPYCALGAVSPDYPNLVKGDRNAFQWADAMHYTRACEMITCGIEFVREARGIVRDKQLAWLLGYCAHVATDVTIHPIVQAKVGVYSENQRQHRVCEMNQDSYIYRRMNLGEIGESANFARIITQCGNSDDISRLDIDIATLWEGMLEKVHPELFIANPPDSTSWHREFVSVAKKCTSDKVSLFPLAAAIAGKIGLAYPTYEDVDHQFIEDQVVPREKPLNLHFDDIFDLAVSNVGVIWRLIEQSMCACGQSQQLTLGDWNLDNGRDEHGKLVFW
jgi:hypothetical protein